MARDYTLTDEEFVTVMNALRFARDEAVHQRGRIAFDNAEAALMQQHDAADHPDEEEP